MRTACLLILFLSTPLLFAAVDPQVQAPEATTSGSEPTAPQAPAPLPLDAKEPFGLALSGGIDRYKFGNDRPEPRKARVEWGMHRGTVNRMLKPVEGTQRFGGNKGLDCLPKKNGVNSCFTNVSAPWTADFGDAFRWSMTPYLQFTPDDLFYSYNIVVPGDAFQDTKQVLLARLGKPTSAKTSTVENRMGAKFDQEVMTWTMKHTEVVLIQRNPSDLTEGILDITYIPLAKAIPPEPMGSAPF